MPPRDSDFEWPPVDTNDDDAVRARLGIAHVALIGCGGLGSNAANLLVRAGVGRLTLIDFDRVDESNLNRQLYFQDELGLAKVDALAHTLRRIRPDVELQRVAARATAENVADLVRDSHVVIEAVDHADTKAMIANTLMRELPQMPLVSASGLAGCSSANEIVTERVGERFYLVGDLESDVRDALPLMASRVMVAAAHEAHAAIRILLGHPEP